MSLVYVNSHNENVYDWNREEGDDIIHPKTYTSIHQKYIKQEKAYDVIDIEPNKKLINTKKGGISLHKTMGYPITPLKSQCDYLRKNEGIKCIKEKGHICDDIVHRAPVPKRGDFKKLSQNDTKNYEKLNIDYVKSAKTRRPIPKYADTRKGDTHELCKPGIMPSYIYAPKFGKMPRYLLNSQKKICEEENNMKVTRNNKVKNDYELLSSNQRNELLTRLKSRWIEIQKTFQTLPVFTDTIVRVQRKTSLEKQLCQLEADILLLENNPYIYICE